MTAVFPIARFLFVFLMSDLSDRYLPNTSASIALLFFEILNNE